MTDIHFSPIPLPAGRKIYMNKEWNGDENLRNLYQQTMPHSSGPSICSLFLNCLV